MTWNSALMTSWTVPCGTWTLAFIAYVVLHIVEKRRGPKHGLGASQRRRCVGEPGQMHLPELTGMGTGAEHPRSQHDGSQAAIQT